MNTLPTFFGAALVGSGVVWLLSNLHVETAWLGPLGIWWPIFLILLGIALLLKNEWVRRLITIVAGLAVGILIAGQMSCSEHDDSCRMHIELHDDAY